MSLGQESSLGQGPTVLVPPELGHNPIHGKIQLVGPMGSGREQKLPFRFSTKGGAAVTVLPQGCCGGHRAAKWPQEAQETSLDLESAGQSTTHQSFWIHGITEPDVLPPGPGETNLPP